MARKTLMVGGVAAALLAGAATGTLYWHRPRGQAIAPGNAQAAAPAPKVTFVDIKQLTLRLADSQMEHYIKLTPVLAVRADSADNVTARVPVIRDRIITLISGRLSTELSTPQGEAKLKHDIIVTLRHDFADQVVGVYFSGYLVE